MPLTERRMRYEAMMEKLRRHSIQQWFADFVDALQDSQLESAASEPLARRRAVAWPLRSVIRRAYH